MLNFKVNSLHRIRLFKTWLKRFPHLRQRLRTVKLTLRSIANGRRLFVGSRNARAFKDWGDYFTAQPIAGYVGWLGHANLGDEALYVGFRQLFPQFQIISANDVHPIELILYRHLVKPGRFYQFVFLGGPLPPRLRPGYGGLGGSAAKSGLCRGPRSTIGRYPGRLRAAQTPSHWRSGPFPVPAQTA